MTGISAAASRKSLGALRNIRQMMNATTSPSRTSNNSATGRDTEAHMKTKSVIDWSALDRVGEELPKLRARLDRLAAETARHQVAVDRFAKKVSNPFWRLLCCRWF